MNTVDFHYSHLREHTPPVVPVYTPRTVSCPRCGAEFVKTRKRCEACQEIVTAEQQQKANDKLKARRAARRALAI